MTRAVDEQRAQEKEKRRVITYVNSSRSSLFPSRRTCDALRADDFHTSEGLPQSLWPLALLLRYECWREVSHSSFVKTL